MLSQIHLASASVGLSKGQDLNAFEIVLVGFTFVFCVLLALCVVTFISGKFFEQLSAKESSSPGDSRSARSTTKNSDFTIDESNPHHIAVIAAAIHCAMDGRKHRIVSISPKDSD